MNIRKILTLATAGTAAASISLFGLGTPAAHADSDQPVTFTRASAGALTLAQDNSGTTPLTAGSAVSLPVTTVTDSRNDVRDWNVTADASDLVSVALDEIAGTNITLGVATSPAAVFTIGSGTVTAGGLVAVTGDSIDSLYTYTPTAAMASQATLGNIPAGVYSGNITQTVV
ncbi:MAG: hypothetical protein QOG43_3279 [Actinomycetota bacterium]|jgi:hypothetical protein|nr:hypothetical protein [Actinomycetota bacterium]